MREYFLLALSLSVCLFFMLYVLLPYTIVQPTASHFLYGGALKSILASINQKDKFVNIDAAKKRQSNLLKESGISFGEYDYFEAADDTSVSVFANLPDTIKVQKPVCSSLVAGDKQAINRSLLYAGLNPYKKTIDYASETVTNCKAFLELRGYIMNVKEEEAEFPLAFSIVMFKDVDQVERLLRAIYRPSNHYCVHVDPGAHVSVRNEMKSIVQCLPNVFFASRSIQVKWGEFSVLETDLICMKDLLKIRGWKYFINLTGQEFPLKTNLQIVNILKILNGTNSIDADPRAKWKSRWQRQWPPPHNITPYKGSVHAIVSHAFVEFAINDDRAKNFIEWLEKTTIPDESFFGTLDNNPHLSIPGTCTGQVATDYEKKPYIARFKNFGKPSGRPSFTWPCRGKRVRQVCVWGLGDLPMLTSRRELFTNKFHINFEPQAFDCIEEWHRNMTNMEYRGKYIMDYTFYRNMPQLKSLNSNKGKNVTQ